MRAVTVRFDEGTHQALRLRAADVGWSVARYVHEATVTVLGRVAGEGGAVREAGSVAASPSPSRPEPEPSQKDLLGAIDKKLTAELDRMGSPMFPKVRQKPAPASTPSLPKRSVEPRFKK